MEPSSKPSTSRNKDWMFCPYTGAMLELDAVKNVAHCQVSGYSIGLDGAPQQAPAQLDPWESHRGTASHLLPAAALLHPPATCGARCRSHAELEDKVRMVQESDMEEYERRFGLEPLVRSERQQEQEDMLHGRSRATVSLILRLLLLF